METFKISNKHISVDINEYILIRVLQISYLRDKRLFEILKTKYEQLTQKKFNMGLVDFKKL